MANEDDDIDASLSSAPDVEEHGNQAGSNSNQQTNGNGSGASGSQRQTNTPNLPGRIVQLLTRPITPRVPLFTWKSSNLSRESNDNND
mmetsp:Transcript_7100/g.12634  ORF Transcript_7100/g.12634 Transcript_7100/m.12634 type:complete len:88 (+) Transcript_7100:511-774(+)|eukprot:CAMPEP_0171485352 /NCGR_PEP_ID=MMETSP0958-20121227/494_1 /TAXON_ID=87120 /ORGANISM="Aurantiochytrium limacinum, Strain ATCCMYA-1381" /LENGTH=87 /DNA_ID=CAMNT_0012018125 /DNA_START=408 /DNA_END=671 /DNA_ORIENTATION=+